MEDMYDLFAQHGALTVNGQGSMVAGVSDVFYGTIGGQEGQDGTAFVAGVSGLVRRDLPLRVVVVTRLVLTALRRFWTTVTSTRLLLSIIR